LDETLAKHFIKEFAKETKLCAREWVDVAMRRHVPSLFSSEHIENVLIHLRGDFGEEFHLVSRKGLRVQSGCGSGLVANGSQGCNIQIISGWLDINGVYLFTHID